MSHDVTSEICQIPRREVKRNVTRHGMSRDEGRPKMCQKSVTLKHTFKVSDQNILGKGVGFVYSLSLSLSLSNTHKHIHSLTLSSSPLPNTQSVFCGIKMHFCTDKILPSPNIFRSQCYKDNLVIFAVNS